MHEPVLGQIEEFEIVVRSFPRELLACTVVALAAIAILYVVLRLIRRHKRKLVEQEPELDIDVSALDASGPPPGTIQLEFYNLPVRLAAVVLAPVGRDRTLPPPEQIHDVIDSVVPGLAEVTVAHQTILHYWPPQLSPRGFAHSFFRHARLPGEAGKGTPWCSAAGVFKVHNVPMMAGLIMSAESNNSFSQVIVELETKWLDLLRIRRLQ